VDYTLEGEKHLGEVYESIQNWLSKEGYLIVSAIQDNHDLTDQDKEKWSRRSIEEVESIRFTAKPLVEVNLDTIQTLEQYLQLISKSIAGGNLPLLADLVRDFPVFEEKLDSLYLGSMRGEKNSDVLLFRSLLLESGAANGEITNKDALATANTLCNGFLSIIGERIREYTNPLGELKSTGKLLSKSIEPINEIPVLLQTGKDREAMNTVITFIEHSQKLIRLYPILKITEGFNMQEQFSTGETLEDYYSEFNSVLRELIEAFSAKDSVLIGDLLEYEISPRIEKLVTIFDSI
jgi:hypothetical protein